MFWRDRRIARPCRKTYNLTLRTIQVRRRLRFSNFLTFTGPLKQREQHVGGRKASRASAELAWSAQSRLCVGYQDNRPRGRGCAPAGANQRSGRDASLGTDLPEGRSVLPSEIKPVPRDQLVPANSLIELWGVCPTSFRRIGSAASARHTASSSGTRYAGHCVASSGKRRRPPEEGGRGSAWVAGQWNVKSDALRPKLARPSTLCTLLRWANSSTWFAEVT